MAQDSAGIADQGPSHGPTALPMAASLPVAQAFRQIVQAECAAFDAALSVTMDHDDPEGPHKARVALRRLRSALTGFAPVVRRSAAAAMGDPARALFRLLGRLRDADVLAQQPADPATTQARRQAADALRETVRADLRVQGALRFGPAVTRMVAGTTWQRRGTRAQRLLAAPLPELAASALDGAWTRALAHGPDLAAMPPGHRHELRKDMKTLRYLGDFFAPLWPGPAQAQFLDRLRRLQDALGTLNDLTLAGAGASPTKDHDRALARAQSVWRALRKSAPWWAALAEPRD